MFSHYHTRTHTAILLSHGRGHWFDPSTVHHPKGSEEQELTSRFRDPLAGLRRFIRTGVRILAVMALGAGLCGCESMSPQTRRLEIAHSLLIAADTSQSIQAQNASDCYTEVDTPARQLIGPHPGKAANIGYGVAHAAVHAMVSGWLDREIDATDDDGWRWIRAGWHVLTLGFEIQTLAKNHREGLSIFEPGSVPRRCLDARAGAK